MNAHAVGKLTLVLFLAGSTLGAAAPTRLALRFNKGDSVRHSIEIHAKGSTGPEGQQMPLEMNMSIRFDCEIVDVKPDGAVNARVFLKEFRIKGMPGMPEMDVVDTLGLEQRMLDVTLDSKGQVVKVGGVDRLSPGGLPASELFQPQQFDYPYFPDKPVEIGESWQHESDSTLPGSIQKGKRVTHYTLRDIKEVDGRQVAIIAVSEKNSIQDATRTISPPMSGSLQIDQFIRSMSVEREGETLFDVEKGRLLGAKSLLKIYQDISISTSVQGQAFPSSIQTQMEWETKEVYDYGDAELPELSDLYSKLGRSTQEKNQVKESSGP